MRSPLQLRMPYPRFILRVFVVALLFAIVLGWALDGVGNGDIASAIIETLIACFWIVVLTLSMRWVVGGEAILYEDRLTIQRRRGRTVVPWSDVENVYVVNAGAGHFPLLRWLSGTRDVPIVEVKLSSPLRIGASQGVFGTNETGRSLGTKLLRIPVAQPHKLANDATAHLKPSDA